MEHKRTTNIEMPPLDPRKYKTSGTGKGDAPRNLGKKFRDNYEAINWGRKK
jgi:hypothetical protein